MDVLSWSLLIVCALLLIAFCETRHRNATFQGHMEKVRRNFKKEVSTRTKRLFKEENPEDRKRDLKELSYLLTHGVADSYDGDMIVPGVEPEHGQAILALVELIKLENSPNLDT